MIKSPPSPALLIHILHLWSVELRTTRSRSVKTENPPFFTFFLKVFEAKCCFCHIVVPCEPCSDEEILIAVCTSDFGKTVHTLKHTHV